jgi:glycosyltransferase involved in cell wall biosynthesis
MSRMSSSKMNSSITRCPAPEAARIHSVLVVHNAFRRFVQIDCEILARKYAVTVRYEASPKKLRLYRIWKEVRRHDLVYCWFAGWHSLFPVLAARAMGKPAVVVVGGYDTANLPEAGYGSQRGGWRKVMARVVMKLATHLIANSCSAGAETVANAGVQREKITVIYHGVPLPELPAQKERLRMALTVGNVWRENLLRKWLLPFVQAALYLPDVRFVLVGEWSDDSIADLREAAGRNVEFPGFVSDQALTTLYSQASVYVQASLHEGFGMSLAEAMAAGCIPVVTQCGAIPEVVGDTGIYLSSAAPQIVADGVARALEKNNAARLRAQKRVREAFSIVQRESALVRLLDRLIPAPASSSRTTPMAEHAVG